MDLALAHGRNGPEQVTFECGLCAHAAVEATLAQLPALREQPGVPGSPPVPPRFLRHSDEQTVVGMAAVLRAMGDPTLRGARFDEWGVLAAPQFPGRVVGAGVFSKFNREGSATVSPQIIPQHSLHSLSGAVSVALGMHGPNFGVGGGRQALAEGLTAALTFLEFHTVPGLWLVLTGWDPEPVPDGTGSTQSPSICRGLALALVSPAEGLRTLRLTVPPVGATAADRDAVPAELTLAGLIGQLAASAGGQPAAWSYALPWGGRIEQVTGPARLVKAV